MPGPWAHLSPECFSAPCIGLSSQIRDYSRPLSLQTAALRSGARSPANTLASGPPAVLRSQPVQVGGLGGPAVGLPEMRPHIQQVALSSLNRHVEPARSHLEEKVACVLSHGSRCVPAVDITASL